MRDLTGGDFPEMHSHLMEKLCTWRVKRRGKKFYMVFLAAGDQFRIHFKREHQLGAHLQLAFCSGSVPRICLLILCLFCKNGAGEITLLHCNSEYPTPYPDANIRAMFALKERFGLEVGYSDHTLGIEVPIAAAALGAVVIEKHFTLDRTMEGPDQVSSIEPDELKKLVESIRHVEDALGSGIKVPTESERKNINVVRKSIVASRAISKGELFTENNLACKRPGGGISPMEWDHVIGLTAVRDFAPDEKIEL